MKAEGFADPAAMVVGLFCTWALDTISFERILKDKMDIASIKRFDIPPPPAEVMRVTTASGTVEIPLDEIRTAIPESCSYCHDMTAEFADVSVGVYEGKEKLNILITRTPRGEELVNSAMSAGFIQAESLTADDVSALASASMNKKRRALSKMAAGQMINRAEGVSLLRVNADILKQYDIKEGGAV